MRKAIGYVSEIHNSVKYAISIEEQRRKIDEYCKSQNIELKTIITGNDPDMKNRDSVITTLDSLSTNDILVVFSIHAIAYSAFDNASLTNILSTRSNSIHCIEENIYSLSIRYLYNY